MRRLTTRVNRLLGRMGIGALFTTASVTGIVLFAFASSVAVSWVGVREARASLYAQGSQLTGRFAEQSRLALLYGSPENAQDAAATLLAFPQIVGAGIYDAGGRVLLESGVMDTPVPAGAPRAPRQATSLEAESDTHWRFVAPVYAADATASDESPFDTATAAPELLGWVRVVQSKSTLAEVARGVVLSNLAASFTIAVVLGLMAWRVTQRITTPIRALADVMTRARAGGTGVRAGEDGPAELRAMEHAFNGMMDVLEQRETDLRTARDAAMEAARAKAQFAAHVSHELRTPLNGLLGMLQLLGNAAGSPRHDEYLRTALSSGRTLLAIINDILDFSRGEAGRIELETRTFALHARMQEVVELLRPMAAAKGLALDLHYGADVPEAVIGDPTRLGQVLTNLLGNAIKFTARGTVRLRVAREYPPGTPEDQAALRLEVQDTGIGIPADALEQIFESFAQASSATARDFGGSGLGLTIARQLVDLMGGRIGVSSTPGQGSTFRVTVTLPVAAHSVGALPLRGVRVLAAVDGHDHTVRELIGRIESLGAEVARHANGGEVLLAAARAHEGARYDAVLLSPAMPEMRASELAQYLMRLPGRDAFRVLLVGREDEPLPPGIDALLAAEADDAGVLAILRPAAPEAPGNLRVLVAEDDSTSQLVARGLLEQAGCAVTCVANGREAVDAVRAARFDLVFMDLNMPEMGGLAATRALRALPGGAHVPVIAMTANAQPQDVALTRSAGMDDFVAKPVQQDAIVAILRRWSAGAGTTAGASVTGHGAVDPGTLDTLRATLGDRVTAIVRTFLDDAATLVRDIHDGAASADVQRLRERAHRLKGAARNVGAVALADAADAVEKSPAAVSQAGGAGLLRALDEALAATRLALQESPAAPAVNGGGTTLARVLVVEDDRSTRMTLRALLEADGYAVTEAEDGREALAMFERQRPDLVLMDAMLPVLDGFAACREIGARAPVLMITSLDDEVSVERAFRAGAADFIPKPINVAVLRRRIERLVSADVKARDAERLAWHDTLTGLINRAAFRERVAREAAGASLLQPCAVLYLDLDRFKRINDTLGHELGDALLVEVAGRLRGCLPESAVLARVGSDEFASVFPCRSTDDAGQVAGRVVAVLGGGVRLRGHELRISASVGVALSPADSAAADALLNYAETAATRAKEEGGNGVQFYQARMSAQLRERLDLEADLRQAIERDQLVVFYQPQVDIAGGRVRGVEALVRWRHPVRGLVPPNDFIPVAEETGLIGMLGEWVLREACVQARRWIAQGLPPLRMGVNVSARQLAAPEFVDVVAHALREAALQPDSLELEVTESVLMRDRDAARALLDRLRALGVRIAIDDFGTGYSSLGYLKHLPVSTLKIDRSFVSGLPVDPHDVAITTGVLSLARNLGIEVVAEGVETGAQLRFLREYGCTLAQGYLFHAPMPASAFESWLATRPADRRRGA